MNNSENYKFDRNNIFSDFCSRIFSNDMYEYNSEEVNMEKIVGEIMPIEEKRSHSRAGCDCQLSVSELYFIQFDQWI